MQKRVIQRRQRKRKDKVDLALLALIVCMIIGIIFLQSKLGGGAANLSWKNPPETSISNGGESSTDEMDSNEEEWCLTLVNKWNPMTTDGSEVETVELTNGERVDKRIYSQLQKMFDAARTDGVYPIVASGYRTKSKQEELYYDKIAEGKAEGMSEEEAKEAAELWVAIPGTSEHQLGLSVDINADGVHSAGNEVYDWLAENAHKYGFINRYPADKTEITGVANEPWHYRYVGVKAATEIYNRGICLEEYLEQ